MKRFLVAALCVALGGCAGVEMVNGSAPQAPLRAIGYAPLKAQPGSTPAQKQLMAIRAAKTAAMRELAEKIYGADIWAQTSVVRGGVASDLNRNNVEGLVRGARVISLQPIRNDVYEAVLEVDAADVEAMRQHARPAFR